MSEKERLVQWFYRMIPPEGELEFDPLLEQAAKQALGKDQPSAEAFVQVNAQRIWNAICIASENDSLRGLRALVVPVKGAMRRGTWRYSAKELARCDRRRHLRGACRPYTLSAIDALTDREYEAAGCFAAFLAGADKYEITPAGNDGGIDFFARIRQPAITHVFSGVGSPLRVVGQSKKYTDPVSVDKIHLFQATMGHVWHVSPHTERLVPAWFRDTEGPVIGWIIAHSGFQSGARTIAKNQGITLSSSLDVSEMCSQSKLIDDGASPHARSVQFITCVRQLVSP